MKESVRNVVPTLAKDDAGDVRLRDSVDGGDVLLPPTLTGETADMAHVLLGQFPVPVQSPNLYLPLERREVPTLRAHVREVFGLRSQEEMIRANTGRVVAAMTDFRPGRNRTDLPLVDEAMGTDLTVAVPEHSVPVFSPGSGPFPAGVIVSPWMGL